MDLKRKRVGVLMGGWSGERAVSLNSGQNVLEALRALGYRAHAVEVTDADALLDAVTGLEVAFNCLHGGVGEDGTLQALLDVLGVPYSGSGMLACALAMDKLRAKAQFQAADLHVAPQAEGIDPDDARFEAWCRETIDEIGLPAVVKPVGEGSSLGVAIARDRAAFRDACREVGRRFAGYFAEAYVPGQEITVGVLRVEGHDRALPPLELRPRNAFYDYEAKYTSGMTEFILPAELDEERTRQVQVAALSAHRALGCFGYSRVDLRVPPEGDPVVLELNTSPGMTGTSDLPQVAGAEGIDFERLCEWMLRSALKPERVPSSAAG